jgi:hypothetical protein
VVNSPGGELAGGLRYVFGHAEQFGLLLLALIYSVFGLSYATILPAFVDQVLHADAAAFGVINAVTGLGAVSGALFVARYGSRGQRGRWLFIGCLVFRWRWRLRLHAGYLPHWRWPSSAWPS